MAVQQSILDKLQQLVHDSESIYLKSSSRVFIEEDERRLIVNIELSSDAFIEHHRHLERWCIELKRALSTLEGVEITEVRFHPRLDKFNYCL